MTQCFGESVFKYIEQTLSRTLGLIIAAAVLLLLHTTWARADDSVNNKLTPGLFQNVFSEITTYHLNPPIAKQLFYNAASILSKQDPHIQTRERDRLVVYYNSRPVFAFRVIDQDDAGGWGAIAQSFVEQIYPHSKILQKQPIDQLAKNVLNILVKGLDQYSHVTSDNTKIAAKNLAEKTFNAAASIGVTVTSDGNRAEIVKIVDRGPAAENLEVGDIIAEIDGASVAGLDAQAIVQLLKGKADTTVQLRIIRDGEPYNFQFTRAIIGGQSFNHYMQNGSLYIAISRFTPGIAAKIRDVVSRSGSQAAGIVLDLRGNRGGVLDEATAIADLFLMTGSMISMRGRHPDSIHEFDADNRDQKFTRPVVVLIDGDSASAAEVLAAALQDNQRAVIAGANSYGKGLVQRATYIKGLGQIAITWAELYKSGAFASSLNVNGVKPNLCLAGSDFIPLPTHQPPEPDKLLTWFRRAPQVTWNSKICPRAPRKDKSEDIAIAVSLIHNPTLYGNLLNQKDI